MDTLTATDLRDARSYVRKGIESNIMPAHFSAKTILFATDFMESSRLALDYAVAFAHHYRAHLLILNVLHMPQAAMEEEALGGPSISRHSCERRLEAFAAGVRRAGVDAEWRLIEGWMPDALQAAVKEIHPDLLTLGTHGVYRGLGHMLLGSNAEAIQFARHMHSSFAYELVATAACPVLTVRGS